MAFLKRSTAALAALAVWVLVAGANLGAAPSASLQEVQAAFLCSFADFVEWPAAAPDAPVTIGILGEDPFGGLLEQMARNRPLQTRPIVVRRLADVSEAPACEMLFVASSGERDLGEIFRMLGPASTLTVSDLPGFAARGGMIGFIVENQRVRFEINVAAAERAHLRISSRLLKLARIVRGPMEPGS